MKSLWLRIYLALVLTLLIFALAAGALVQGQWGREREQAQAALDERIQTLVELLAPTLLPASAAPDEQAAQLQRWSLQLRFPLALEDRDGRRLATSLRYQRREDLGLAEAPLRFTLADERRLLVLRPIRPGPRDPRDARDGRREAPPSLPPWLVGTGVPALVALLLMLFISVALAAWPVARRLTRRLEVLQQGVERFGQGDLAHRVPAQGRDEVAALAHSFNNAAARIEQLVSSHRSLLANASHELRSPLARLRMALTMRQEASDDRSPSPLDGEIERNLRELDALVDEVLLASRLEAGAQTLSPSELDAVALAAELAAQHGVELGELAAGATLEADERLLRRALRNLLENARRYGGEQAELHLLARDATLEFRVLDRGPGVPEALRERIFEPFFRQPGHAEVAGGVGLGLALVRQIALAHGGRAWVEARDGGGAVFVLSLPR